MAKFNLRINPTPHGKYNRTKGIILTLLTYCKDTQGNSKGLPLAEIADLVKVHDLNYESAKSFLFRNYGFNYLLRKPKPVSKGQSVFTYSISATGQRWLDKYVSQDMRLNILLPMLSRLEADDQSIKRLFGG